MEKEKKDKGEVGGNDDDDDVLAGRIRNLIFQPRGMLVCLFGKGGGCRRFFGYHTYGCNTLEFLVSVWTSTITGRLIEGTLVTWCCAVLCSSIVPVSYRLILVPYSLLHWTSRDR